MPVLKTVPVVTYDGTDITADITEYLKEIRISDQLSARADDLEIVLEDRAGLWRGAWFPEKGAKLAVTLQTGSKTLAPGQFEIDEITASGYPSEARIRAVSVPDNTTLRAEEHTRSWEKTDLKSIASDLAQGSGVTLFWDVDEKPSIERAEQTEQGDLAFLLELCEDHGLALKVSDGKLIIFDEAKYEQQPPAFTIVKPDTDYNPADGMTYITALTSWSYTSRIRCVYAAAHVKHQDSKTKRTIEATFMVPNKKGKTLQIKEQVSTVAEAETLAKKRLRDTNKNENTGSISMPGNPDMNAGITVKLLGFGEFDGVHLITHAEHSLNSSGYTTRIQIRKCLDGY